MADFKIENRTLFIELFTKEIMHHINKKNDVDKFSNKLPKEIKNKIEEKKEDPILLASEFSIKEETTHNNVSLYNEEIKGEETKVEINVPDLKIKENKPLKQRIIDTKFKIQPKHQFLKPKSVPLPIKKIYSHPIKQKESINYQVIEQNNNFGINLGKINPLIYDKEVTIIECPGADKFILVKKEGKINLTKMKISQDEIEQIINEFSQKSRIPTMEGIFKAIVGDCSINAVITDSQAHRFIIYKKSPYSMMGQ
jgi:hypothetical protein